MPTRKKISILTMFDAVIFKDIFSYNGLTKTLIPSGNVFTTFHNLWIHPRDLCHIICIFFLSPLEIVGMSRHKIKHSCCHFGSDLNSGLCFKVMITSFTMINSSRFLSVQNNLFRDLNAEKRRECERK